jgi:predicted permease
MRTLRQDLLYAWRQLRRNPGFSLVTVLTLALGIGATTAIFSAVNSVLLRPLPYQNGARIVHLGYRDPASGQPNVEFSVQELGDYQVQSQAFSDFIEYHSMPFTLLGWGEPDRVQTGVVSPNFFDVLGIKALVGRTFHSQEDPFDAPPGLLLTEEYWRSRFGGDPGVIGRNMRMNDRLITVVGVLPRLPAYPQKDKVFMTVQGCPARSSERVRNSRDARMLEVFGMLKPGATLAQARVEVATIAARLAQEHPEVYEGSGSEVPLIGMEEELTGKFRPTIFLLLLMVVLLLFIACTNVAGLTLARLLHRRHEVLVRTALGAGRSRIIRQLMTESTLLGLLGGLLGIALAAAGSRLLIGFAGRFTPRATEIALDGRVLLFALALSLLAGLACGIVPALQISRQNLAGALRDGVKSSSGKHLFRSLLVVAQVAASFILLIGAGLTLRSLFRLQDVDAGFKAENVLSVRINLASSKYQTDQQTIDFFQTLLQKLAANPQVRSAATASAVPLDGLPMTPDFRIDGRPEPSGDNGPKTKIQIISDDYFKTLGIPLLEGRSFDARDRQGSPQVVVVNRALAQRYWPGSSPIGQRVAFPFLGEGKWAIIVGVVGDVKQAGLANDTQPETFFDFQQLAGGQMLLVRSAGSTAGVLPIIRRAIYDIDPEQPIADVRTLEEVRSDFIAPSRLTALLLTLFALVAFTVTAIGVSGIVAFSVSERTREIGIRAALGARRTQLLALVLKKGVALVLIGLLIGLLGALLVTRLLTAVLYGVQPVDPATFVTVSLVLLILAVLACLVPARRATRIDPITALRAE